MVRRWLFVLAIACVAAPSSAAASPCSGENAYIHVVTDTRTLWLCNGPTSEGSYGVHLGWGGLGKTTEGDGKVPLGTYPLEAPRPSTKYGTFIPVGYPTPAQRENGYTGSAIGIHGPRRMLRWLGSATNWFDTTDGCLGIATDAEMNAVAAWVRRSKAAWVVIETQPEDALQP